MIHTRAITRTFASTCAVVFALLAAVPAAGQRVNTQETKPVLTAPNGQLIRPAFQLPRLYREPTRLQWLVDFLIASPDQADALRATVATARLEAQSHRLALEPKVESAIDEFALALASGVTTSSTEQNLERAYELRNRATRRIALEYETALLLAGEDILSGAQLNRLPYAAAAISRWITANAGTYVIPECRQEPVHFVLARSSARGLSSPTFIHITALVLSEYTEALDSAARAMHEGMSATTPAIAMSSSLITHMSGEERLAFNRKWFGQQYRGQERYAALATEVVYRLTDALPEAAAKEIRLEWEKLRHPISQIAELGIRERLLAISSRSEGQFSQPITELILIAESSLAAMQRAERKFFRETRASGFTATELHRLYVNELLAIRENRNTQLLAGLLELEAQASGSPIESSIASLLTLIREERVAVTLLREVDPLLSPWPGQ